jgi:hypothetical protein
MHSTPVKWWRAARICFFSFLFYFATTQEQSMIFPYFLILNMTPAAVLCMVVNDPILDL